MGLMSPMGRIGRMMLMGERDPLLLISEHHPFGVVKYRQHPGGTMARPKASFTL